MNITLFILLCINGALIMWAIAAKMNAMAKQIERRNKRIERMDEKYWQMITKRT